MFREIHGKLAQVQEYNRKLRHQARAGSSLAVYQWLVSTGELNHLAVVIDGFKMFQGTMEPGVFIDPMREAEDLALQSLAEKPPPVLGPLEMI